MKMDLLPRDSPMMLQPAMRSNWQVCDALPSSTTHRGSPDVAGWSAYPSIAAISISLPDRRDGPLATNAVQQIASYSITSSARAEVLPDRMSTPRRPDAGVPQRPRPAPDAHASLLKLPPPQIIFCAATPAPGLRPLVWVNAPSRRVTNRSTEPCGIGRTLAGGSARLG